MTEFLNPDEYLTAPGTVVRAAKDRHASALLYPPMGFDPMTPAEVFTVGQNEVVEVDIALGISASHVQQPQAVKALGASYLVPDFSCYTVLNNLGAPVDPKEWRNYGGKITVTINPDTVTAKVTLRGPSLELGPFTIGNDSSVVQYGTLFLLGTGVAIWKKQLTIDTGLTDDDVSDDSTAELDNPFMQSREQAYDAAHEALGRRLGGFQRATLSLSGASGIDGLDSQRPESALGRIAGARVIFDGSFYRIRSASITASGIDATCEQDTTFGDLNAAFGGSISLNALNALHAGQRFRDFDADPLSGGNVHG